MTVDAKISGNDFLSLKKDSLEQFGLSTEFQTPLMKIIEEIVCHLLNFIGVLFEIILSCTVGKVPTIP